MPFMLIPREAETDRASIWIGAINEQFDPGNVKILGVAGELKVADAWLNYQALNAQQQITYQVITLDHLQPQTKYSLILLIDGEAKADASITTLPENLPVFGQKPLIVLLGSCFYWHEDRDGKVGNTYFHLPFGESPDLKILCGDQVYLDAPWRDFLLAWPHPAPDLENRFIKTYRSTWLQNGVTSGFQQLLKTGANYFSSDDHEFWNNAPNASFSNNTWTAHGRSEWLALARNLYTIFQSNETVNFFSVGNLSFCNADTRINRDANRNRFMLDADLDRVGNWLSNLSGPGVLVVGQPVLSQKTSFFKGEFGDWGISDFKQYDRLINFIKAARHSVMILTGDVHYGRVASAPLRPELGTELIEIISSPLSLVDEKAAGTWTEAPEIFRQTRTVAEFAHKQSHFLTLEFYAASPQRISLTVKFWPIVQNGTLPKSSIVYQTSLI